MVKYSAEMEVYKTGTSVLDLWNLITFKNSEWFVKTAKCKSRKIFLFQIHEVEVPLK